MVRENSIVATLRAAGCVFAEDEAQLLVAEAGTEAELDSMVKKRAGGMPLEYVVGWAEFCGMRIKVEPGVFVPRRRSEFLVQQAAELAGSTVLDLCCGSGALGVALASMLAGQIELHATDLDPLAVRCARGNLAALGGKVYEGNLFDSVPSSLKGRIDIVLANTPYVPTKAIAFLPQEARLYEATAALDGGTDGLEIQRRVAAEAPHWLAPGGHLLVETSEEQARAAAQIFTNNGLEPLVVRSEEWDATVVIGKKEDSYGESKQVGFLRRD